MSKTTRRRVKETSDTHSRSEKKWMLLVCLFLATGVLIVFWQVTRCDFITLDDSVYVTGNTDIQEGLTLKGVEWAFTTCNAGYWHPLTWISHMGDVQLFGLQPGWHHLTSLLFHLANTLLLFLILHRMTKALWQSAFVAALFALHPLHVESVAWVAERKDVLSTFFWMLTMGTYVYYVARPGFKRYVLVLLCFALGLMAKPMLVTIPFVLLLLDYWPLQRLEPKPSREAHKFLPKDKTPPVKAAEQPGSRWPLIRPLLVEKIPLFVLTVLASIVVYVTQLRGGAVMSLGNVSPGVRLENVPVSYIAYILKMLWPTNLSVLYPLPGWWPLWKFVGATAVLLALTIFSIKAAKKRAYVTFGWLWYLCTLVPVIGIVQVGVQAMADRFTYVPSIGLFVIVAWAVPEALKKWSHRKEALVALSVSCLLCLSVVTWRQVGYWRDGITLYDHALENAGSSIIYNNRGMTYGNLGDCNRAIADFDRAIEIDPGYGGAYNNRGMAYGSLGNYSRAIADFDKAIEISPKYAVAYSNRGVVYNSLGNYNPAIADFDKAIEISPKYAVAYNNRGMAYGSLGNCSRAIADFDRAIEINPRYGGAYTKRGMAYGSLGNSDHAIDDLRTAARLGQEGAKNFLRSRGVGW